MTTPARTRILVVGTGASAARRSRLAAKQLRYLDLPVVNAHLETNCSVASTPTHLHRALFDAVRDERIWGVLITDPATRFELRPLAFALASVAFAWDRRVFLVDGMGRRCEDELTAWGVVDLKGDMGQVGVTWREAFALPVRHPDLFDPVAPCFEAAEES